MRCRVVKKILGKYLIVLRVFGREEGTGKHFNFGTNELQKRILKDVSYVYLRFQIALLSFRRLACFFYCCTGSGVKFFLHKFIKFIMGFHF